MSSSVGNVVSRLSVKQLNADAQPREKAVKFGIDKLTTVELWAIILRVGVKGVNVLDLADEMMRRNDYLLSTLERNSLKELENIRGMGTTKAIQVLAVMEIIRRYKQEKIPERLVLSSSDTVYNYMREVIANLDHEEIWCIMLDRRNAVIRRLQLSKGGTASSVFDVKMLLKAALLDSASGIILCHNHPSGQLRPSTQDDTITRRCREACTAVDIRMLDHIILTVGGHYSYANEGRL